jgi:hypothetical protein
MKKAVFISVCLLSLLRFNCRCWAWATQQCGNAPFHENNYTDWPGIMPVINHTTRVYQVWVNGTEAFFYKGDTAELNDCLKKFAGLGAEVREVLIRPGPAKTKTFDGDAVPYDWQLNIHGGVSKHLTTLDRGSKIWSKHPTLTIYTGERIALDKIEIPEGVKVIEIRDLKKRYHEGLLSSDKTVRGWGAGRLASLDPYDKDNLERIVRLLEDDDEWVRLNAAGALIHFGRKARPAIPALKECSKSANEGLRKQIEKSIHQIQTSEDKSSLEKQHRRQLRQIRSFVEALKQQKN